MKKEEEIKNTTTTTTTNDNDVIIKAYTDIENQSKATHGHRRYIILPPPVIQLPPPPLSEQEAEEKKQQRFSSSGDENNYPDIKKVALSEISWSLEELFSRSDNFWHCFEDLEYDDGANTDGTVDHNRLQKALIKSSSSSKKRYFATAGDVLFMIELMLRTGKIIEVGFHKYKKR